MEKILGFEVIIRSDFSQFWPIKQLAWKRDNEYISTRAEFGASPIRDKKSIDRYCKLLESYGLQYTVHPLIRANMRETTCAV
jgi:hypothetical protein